MSVLITGATGLIGKVITNLLHKHGYTVHYLTTRKNKIETRENYKGYYWNPTKGEIDLASLVGVNYIINLAGATVSKRWTSHYKKEILNSRINSIRTLKSGIEKSSNTTIEGIVSASAIGIYPNSYDSLYTEDDKRVDDSFLGEVVAQWEDEIDTLNELGCSVAKIRIGLVLSSKGGALPKMAQPIRNFVGAAFGSGEQWQSWIHIKDLARMFIFLMEKKQSGVFNGVAPNPITNSKLTREIATTLKKPLILPNIPKVAMNLILGEMAYILFSSQRVSSMKIVKRGFQFYHTNIKAALTDLLSDGKQEKSKTKTSFSEGYI
jgi:uncharacterized protein (TIGR01777 family)